MPGKRPRPMRRTSSVSLIGSGSINGDSSPLPEHPKEKLKSSASPAGCCVPRQVIGFHPKVSTNLDDDSVSVGPCSPLPPHGKSPSGSPRSGLGDLLAVSKLWGRREVEGVGLGIVVALHDTSSPGVCEDEICQVRDNGKLYPVLGFAGKGDEVFGRSHVSSSPFPSKQSHPITIHPPYANSPSPRGQSSQRHAQNASPHFGLTCAMQESQFVETFERSISNCNGGSLMHWSHQADMDVDKGELPLLAPMCKPLKLHLGQLSAGISFLDSCYFCKRELGEGRDIYMYRGDRAFCSPECRHQQIVNDERPEKCSSAAIRSDSSRHSSHRNRVMAAGTAAAA